MGDINKMIRVQGGLGKKTQKPIKITKANRAQA
jgi:hypothetical protein